MTQAVNSLQEYLTAIQSGVEGTLKLSTALAIVKPPKDEKPDDGDVPQNPPPEPPNHTHEPSWTDESSDALLDGREEDLKAISDAIQTAWEAYENAPVAEIKIDTTLPSNNRPLSDVVSIDRSMLEWVDAFCNREHWGGFLETTESSLIVALAGAADNSPVFVCPDSAVTLDGEVLSLESLLIAWDEDLPKISNTKTNLTETWRNFQFARESLLPHIEKLIYHPRSWLDGRPEIIEQVREYLKLAANLYREVQENYTIMAENSPDWARSVLETLLALDIVQLRVRLPNSRFLAKAVLLPTHPLHLWRNERLSTLLRGLAQSTNMNETDRKLLRKELERPEQFLSVVRLGSLPAGCGLNQLLPLTNEVKGTGLPVFENLINTCSGEDGATALKNALDQYIVLHPNHPFPLRLALVNPPRPEVLMMELVRLLNDPRYRGGQKLSAVRVTVYATGQHTDRLRATLSFSDTQKEDDVQEKIASGRLSLNIDESCLYEQPELKDIVERIRQRPCHVAAIFDESTIGLRQRGAHKNLPISPFCIRYDVQVDQRSGRIELRPQPGESPFSEFRLLMSELEGNQRNVTYYAYADAEALAGTADAVLQTNRPASRWLFLADRALPSEAGMTSVRIWERREGMRDTFLATRDFEPLARLIRPVFSKCNLTLSPKRMSHLLHQGARLLGSGMLEIIKKQDGQPDQKKVIGFAGLLLAARDFQRRYPGALVLSVDHPLARLWLRTGSDSLADRCDLLVLWKDEASSSFQLLAVEVKTSDGKELNDGQNRLTHAMAQIANTLEAVQDGLGAVASGQSSPLSIPRCEMLKQTLVRAAQARTGDPSNDRINRLRWGSWLTEIFASSDESVPIIQLSGCVIGVLLRREAAGTEHAMVSFTDWPMLHRTLCRPEADELLEWDASTPEKNLVSETVQVIKPQSEKIPVTESFGSQSGDLGSFELPPQPTHSVHGSKHPNPQVEAPVQNDSMRRADSVKSVQSNQCETPGKEWPPAVNALGMIGQYQEVDLLVKQALYAKTMGERFSDKLLVGPAGVGKSTLARNIGAMLLNRDAVTYSGSDLRRPLDLLERLRLEGLVPEVAGAGTIPIEPCLIFIDEVHGIASSTAIALLSAMDDRRVTSIDGRLYDFNRVVFLLATTDQGKLSEAFQSRPNKTSLRPYTLHELAGIVWLHGKQCLDGSELTQEACYEIAARMRCSPRRSVRELSEVLRPNFFHRVMERQNGQTPTLVQVAKLMTNENIAAFYEARGIDRNGLDELAMRYLNYLKRQGAASEATLSQALGLTHRQDFVEVREYLVRLGLIETFSGPTKLQNVKDWITNPVRLREMRMACGVIGG